MSLTPIPKSSRFSKWGRRTLLPITLIGIAIAWLVYVPVPSYLPVEPSWSKQQAQTWRSFEWKTNRYFEFYTDEKMDTLLPGIRVKLDAAGPWESASEQDDQSILDWILNKQEGDLRKKLANEDIGERKRQLAIASVPFIAGKYGGRLTAGPFLLLDRFRTEQLTHRSIIVRLSPSPQGGTRIDIWDLFVYDH